MNSYKTEFKRKRLKIAYSNDSPLIFIESEGLNVVGHYLRKGDEIPSI